MGDMDLKCPLCCDQIFDSKPALLEHLADIYENITCPVCNNKWSSLDHLIEHLKLDNCQPVNAVPSLDFNTATESESNENSQNSAENVDNFEEVSVHSGSGVGNVGFGKVTEDLFYPPVKDNSEDGTDESQMYVELLNKQLITQELKLVNDDGVSRYILVSNGDSKNDSGTSVLTKQNDDGTISLTTVRVPDVKQERSVETKHDIEDQLVFNQPEPVETEETQEEIYSCNTCGVSFTSVLDHIQNYHNDQEVVVEEPMDVPNEEEEEREEILPQIETKQALRRMITETGDIIETPLVMKPNTHVKAPKFVVKPGSKQEIVVVGKDTQPNNSKRYVVYEKFCDSMVKDIHQPDAKSGPYHKVVIKEMEIQNGEKVKVFSCISCSLYVTTLDDFKLHPCKNLKYSCSQCPVSYENAKSLCAHMKVHKPKPDISETAVRKEPLYECELCNTTFPTNKSLKLHKRMHDPIKSRPIDPPVEGADGAEASSHKFLCTVCNKMIPMDYRRIHQDSHKYKDEFNCNICNKKFQSMEYLEMHMGVHSTDKAPISKQDKSLPYTCLFCARRFARPHEKVKHERIHTGEKPHSCEICGKSFRVAYCLTLHMRTHTGARPYHCDHCGKRFKAHSVYNHHLLTHSDVRAYKCTFCPKAFKTSVQLAGHKNSHTKPFSCQTCNRPFASLYAVRVHTETHSRQNNLKFSCTLCGASYARAFALKDHMKQAHKDDLDKPATPESISEQKTLPSIAYPTVRGRTANYLTSPTAFPQLLRERINFKYEVQEEEVEESAWTEKEDTEPEQEQIIETLGHEEPDITELSTVAPSISNELVV